MEVKVEQLNILMNAIRTIVKNNNCPEWISKRLTEAVKDAKSYISKQQSTCNNDIVADTEIRPFELNDIVISNISDDNCVYQIIGQSDPINGVNLFTLKIIKSKNSTSTKNPIGYIIHNVPETQLQHIKKN